MINIVHEIISYYKINALQELLIIVEFIILKQQFTIRCDYRLGSLNRTSLVGDYSWVHSFLWGCLQSLWDTRGWTRTGNPLRVGHGSCHAETCGILHRGWSRQVLACRVKHAGKPWKYTNIAWGELIMILKEIIKMTQLAIVIGENQKSWSSCQKRLR